MNMEQMPFGWPFAPAPHRPDRSILDRRRFEEFKNFANKMWNGARFVLLNLEGNEAQGNNALEVKEFSQGFDESKLLKLEDQWILSY